MLRDVNGVQIPPEQADGAVLCVANTHLFWDPDFADVKLWQTHMLVRELEKLTHKRRLPLILCGDFNSEPTSAVHKLLAGNAMTGHRFQLRREDLPPDPHRILPEHTHRLSHGLLLQSAYGTVLGEEPEFTNYTEQYVGCLDYIWVSADRATPVAVLRLPEVRQLTAMTRSALPNPQHPSDHLSLCADIVIGMPSQRLAMTIAQAQGQGQIAGAMPGVGIGVGVSVGVGVGVQHVGGMRPGVQGVQGASTQHLL